ncbi:sugar transferase [Psychrobacter sanguinis]|uniref:sugar transferase n=1 Tax=Psychrobacter sanguinis TaxID=861445 RepID=UPI001918E98A|nr:sugar transferase [Psychrobacter sanguinis]MCC3345958.1 sugar transferase [Psychrobacter sanguinis]
MIKRLFDITASGAALVALSPVLAITAYKVKKNLGSPVLFKQTRPGLNAEPFEMLKFRSMTDARDSEGNLLPDSERLTDFGRFLRKSSLDELPELWNIFKGDMSIVGPRPLLMRYLPYYTEEENKRHDVRPGLTGLAQISGRNALTWEEKLALDVKYVEEQSFLNDMRIILKTIIKVSQASDILESAPQGPLDKYREELYASK